MALPRINFDLSSDERLPAALLLIFFLVLCVAGGASREDVLAQSVIRAFAVVLMLIQVVFGRAPDLSRYKACATLLTSMMAVAALQLAPLPPEIWNALPGRAIIATSPLGAGGWRPLNLVPDAGWNALFSLLIPLCMLLLLSSLRNVTVRRTQYLLITATIFSALLALLQATGAAPDNPLINGTTTDYAGIFANRNHQALFLAIGIVVLWFWGGGGGRTWRDRRLWLAICVIVLLFVSILVTGSRSGTLLGGLAVIAGPMFAVSRQRSSGKLNLVLWPTVSIVIVGGAVALSVRFGRALSLDRAASLTLDSEFRLRSLSTVWSMAKAYFPFGAGLGSFDNVFRIAEPFSLLEPTYFNHAHNDFLETMIETGVFGPAIFLCALAWALRQISRSVLQGREDARMRRMGALVFGLVIVASLSDYPARTPMIMAMLTIAACWLTGITSKRGQGATATALPCHANSL